MSDLTPCRLAALSRRKILQGLARAGSGAALLATMAQIPSAAAQAKAAQKVVAYQATPHGTQECDNCRQFVAPNACKVVDGDVSPQGWCKVYVKKPVASS